MPMPAATARYQRSRGNPVPAWLPLHAAVWGVIVPQARPASRAESVRFPTLGIDAVIHRLYRSQEPSAGFAVVSVRRLPHPRLPPLPLRLSTASGALIFLLSPRRATPA